MAVTGKPIAQQIDPPRTGLLIVRRLTGLPIVRPQIGLLIAPRRIGLLIAHRRTGRQTVPLQIVRRPQTVPAARALPAVLTGPPIVACRPALIEAAPLAVPADSAEARPTRQARAVAEAAEVDFLAAVREAVAVAVEAAAGGGK